MVAVQTQPPTVRPSFRTILSFPYRLCHPPPAIGKVRSFGVTPLFDVRLDDVLDRKHLPPLGLKDFEEWLLYVELCPENLYFILWLRDYRTRYAAWQKQCDSPNDAAFASTAASRLAVFYSRAKQTFLVPGANYELNLPASIAAPFHSTVQAIRPDPAIFCEAEKETRRMLEQSLRRFIQSQMINVGNRRALCGIIAGFVIIIFGFLPPIIANFLKSESRWLRLTALPGVWLGLTILFSALHGVCIAVYVFGDLRQLRKFELARPPATKVQGFKQHRILPLKLATLPSYPPKAYSCSDGEQKLPPFLGYATDYPDSVNSIYSRETQHAAMSGMTETNPLEGPSTSPILFEYYSNPDNDNQWLRQQESDWEQERALEPAESVSPASFSSTATFIAPFCSPSTSDISGYWDNEEMLSMNAHWYQLRAMADLEKLDSEAARGQPVTCFDFDGLPPASAKSIVTPPNTGGIPESDNHAVEEPQSQGKDSDDVNAGPRRWKWLLDIIDRIQTRCSFKKWGPGYSGTSGPAFLGGVPPYLSSLKPSTGGRSSHANSKSASTHSIATSATPESDVSTRARKRFRLVNAVPAFAVPLTRVLSPVIVRGQWEIVIRSTAFALLVSWAICGPLLAIPP